MKAFLILSCAVAFAAADIEGYDYSPAVPPAPPVPSGLYGTPQQQQQASPGAIVDNYVPKVFKHVHVYSAPDEEVQREKQVIRVPGGDKHVNIIFVKAPSSSSSSQTEVILPDQDEHKNLVYVLLNKNEFQNDVKITRPQSKAPSKPEVHFIRYADTQSASQASPVSPPAKPSGLYGTPQAEPIVDSAVIPPPVAPSGLYGTPQADPVSVPAPPAKPSGLYGTPQVDAAPAPPRRPSRLYGLPSL